MKSATVTYVAPVGDNKVVEMGGMTFHDGQSVEINSVDNPGLFEKLQNNQFFDFSMGKDEPDTVKPKVKRGRPSNADVAAAKAAADQADQERQAAEAKAKAARADADAAEKASRGDDASKPANSSPSTGKTNTDTLADAPSSSTDIPLGPAQKTPAEPNSPAGLTGTSPAPAGATKTTLPAQPSPLAEPTKVEK